MSHIISGLLWNTCLAGGLAIVLFLAQQTRYLRIRPPCLPRFVVAGIGQAYQSHVYYNSRILRFSPVRTGSG